MFLSLDFFCVVEIVVEVVEIVIKAVSAVIIQLEMQKSDSVAVSLKFPIELITFCHLSSGSWIARY